MLNFNNGIPFLHISYYAFGMVSWDNGWDSENDLWNTSPSTFHTDETNMIRYSNKHSVNSPHIKSLCECIFRHSKEEHSLLISENSLSMRICLLEYIVSPFLIDSNKTVFIHISEFLPNITSTLDFKCSALFGGTFANFSINNSKKIFSVSYRDYSYLEYQVIPSLTDDKVLFIYLGNNLLNSSPMPGFKHVQNMILSSDFLTNDTIKSHFPYSHLYRDELYNICIDHHNNVSYNRDEVLSSQRSLNPKPNQSTNDQLFDRLMTKHKATQYKSDLEYLINIVMQCIHRKASIVVDGFYTSILTCMLDYVIMKTVERATGLCTIIDYSNSMAEQIRSLEIMGKECDINSSRKVILAHLKEFSDYNILYESCILISYTSDGCKLPKLPLFNGPFLSISPSKISDKHISKVSRPFLHIHYVEINNEIVCTRCNGFDLDVDAPKRVEMPADKLIGDLPFNSYGNECTTENEQSNSTESLLTRLTQKFNCDLKFISTLCTILSYLLEKGESVIMDNFSIEQLACLLDFVISNRINNNSPLICCDTKLLASALSLLDVVQLSQYLVVDPNFPLHSNNKVLFLDDMKGLDFYQKLKTQKWLNPSYLLIKFSYQTDQLDLMFSHSDCQILCLTVATVEQSIKDLILRSYTNIKHTKQNDFEVNEFRYKVPTPLSVVDNMPTDKPINSGYCETDIDSHGNEESLGHPTISTTDQLLYRLAIKHDVFRYKCVLEYIIGIVLDCIAMGASVAVDGFNISVLNCMLDYVIMTRVRHATQLCTVVEYTKLFFKELETLDIVKTNDYARVRNLIYTQKKVLFSRLRSRASHLLSTLSDDCLFVIYSKSGYKFNYLSLVGCPFLILSPKKLSESLLARINIPFLHVSNEKLNNNVVCTPRHVLGNNQNMCPIERRFDIEMQPRLSTADEHESADQVELLESVPPEMARSKSPDNLLPRLTTKYKCSLEYTSSLCTTLADFLHNGKSVIVDNFTLGQLACLLDFVISDRLTNGSNNKIIIYCYKKAFKSTLQYLDIVLCNQYQIIDERLSFNPVTRVLISHFQSRRFYKDLNRLLNLDRSCLFVNLNKNGGNVPLLFSLTNCQILGLCQSTLRKSGLKTIQRRFINIRHTSINNFIVNDSDQLKLPTVLIPPNKSTIQPDKHRYKDHTQQNYTSLDIKNSSEINSLFLHKQNPISNLINQLFDKHNIKLLTELPSDLYNTLYTLLLERRNLAVDGFSVIYVSPLISIYALECKSLGTPVSICYGTCTIVVLKHFQYISVIPTDSILHTLTTNTDTNHLWLFIGLDNTVLSQVIPLIKIPHQCVFLLSHGFPYQLEQAHIPITRVYRMSDCINIRSYNSQLTSLLPENVDTFYRDSLEITSECVQAQADISVDIIPTTCTASTTQQESNNQNIFLDTKELILPNETDNSCNSMNELESVLEYASLDLIEIGHNSLQDNSQQVNNSFPGKNCTTLMSEFVTESDHIEFNVVDLNNQFYSKQTLDIADSNEIENSDSIEIIANPNFTRELMTKHEFLTSLTGINQDLITQPPAIDTATEYNDEPVIAGNAISELESIKSFDTSTIRFENLSSESDHTVITDTPNNPNIIWSTDLIAEHISNEISDLYCPPIELPILLPDSRTPEFNSLLTSDLITSPVKNPAEFNTELFSNSNALTPGLEENTNILTEINPDVTELISPIQHISTDLLTEQVSNEIPKLNSPIEIPILLPDSRTPEFNSLLASDLITSPVKNPAEFTELFSNANALTPGLEENTNIMTEINPDVTELISTIQHISTDLITEQVLNEIPELYCPPIELPVLLPDSRAHEFNSVLASDLITSPVKTTDTRIEHVITPELSKIESFNSPITNTQLSLLGNTSTLPEPEHVTDISEQLEHNLLATHTTTEPYHPINIPLSLPDSTVSESDPLPSCDRILSPAAETYTETEFNSELFSSNTNVITPGLEENTNIMTELISPIQHITTDLIPEQVPNEISDLYPTPLLDSIAPDFCSYSSKQDKTQSPSKLGLHLITSPLHSGIHTVLFSSDSAYYIHILHHIASVLDYTTSSLQVVLTSHGPEICSQLMGLASSHLHTGTNGFLYKTGPIHQLSNFIVKQKIQILSIPVSPLVSLVQSNPTLFIENKILVYVEGSTACSISELLSKSIAKQCIFILSDNKAFSTLLHIFPTPYCEIKFHQFSSEIERYTVEFHFPSL